MKDAINKKIYSMVDVSEIVGVLLVLISPVNVWVKALVVVLHFYYWFKKI